MPSQSCRPNRAGPTVPAQPCRPAGITTPTRNTYHFRQLTPGSLTARSDLSNPTPAEQRLPDNARNPISTGMRAVNRLVTRAFPVSQNRTRTDPQHHRNNAEIRVDSALPVPRRLREIDGRWKEAVTSIDFSNRPDEVLGGLFLADIAERSRLDGFHHHMMP